MNNLNPEVAELITALNNKDWQNIEQISEKLVEIHVTEAINPLIELLKDDSYYIPKIARDALVKFGSKAVEPLIKTLSDGEEQQRAESAKCLGEIGDKSSVSPLIRALNDTCEDVKNEAARALAIIGDIRALEPLFPFLDGNSYRGIIANYFGKMGDLRAVEPLISALNRFDVSIAEALSLLGDKRAVEPLIKSLDIIYWHKRVAVISALGKLGDKRAIIPLIKSIISSWGKARLEAANALMLLGEPYWKSLITGKEEDFQKIAKCKDERLLNILLETIDDERNDVISCLSRILLEFDDVAILELLLKRSLTESRIHKKELIYYILFKLKNKLQISDALSEELDKIQYTGSTFVFQKEGTPKTPHVHFDWGNGIFDIKGRSIAENAIEFYKPVVDSMDEYVRKYPYIQLTASFRLEYFNTSDSKCLLDLFKKMEQHRNTIINWYYEEDDEDMLEAGEDYESIIRIPFNLIEIAD